MLLKENIDPHPVSPVYDVHTHLNNESGTVAVRNLSPLQQELSEGWFSCGIHPWWLWSENYSDETWLEWLRKQCAEDRVIALGECGFDLLKGGAVSRQSALFKAQCILAQSFELPVVLHAVKADHLLLPLIRSYPDLIFLYHGFSGKWSRASEYLKLGVYLSFGPRTMNNPAAIQSLRNCPSELLFLETDDSEVTITEWYKKAADLKECSLDDLCRLIEINFLRVFKRYGQKLA